MYGQKRGFLDVQKEVLLSFSSFFLWKMIERDFEMVTSGAWNLDKTFSSKNFPLQVFVRFDEVFDYFMRAEKNVLPESDKYFNEKKCSDEKCYLYRNWQVIFNPDLCISNSFMGVDAFWQSTELHKGRLDPLNILSLWHPQPVHWWQGDGHQTPVSRSGRCLQRCSIKTVLTAEKMDDSE